jgi:hypothetical protein
VKLSHSFRGTSFCHFAAHVDAIIIVVIVIFALQLPHPCNDELMAKGVDAMTKWQ